MAYESPLPSLPPPQDTARKIRQQEELRKAKKLKLSLATEEGSYHQVRFTGGGEGREGRCDDLVWWRRTCFLFWFLFGRFPARGWGARRALRALCFVLFFGIVELVLLSRVCVLLSLPFVVFLCV
jgi:hypothetical protein